MKKSKLLFLTNLYNCYPEEDIFLAKYLEDFFDVTISNPRSCEAFENNCDAILIRNIWYTSDYNGLIESVFKRFKDKKLKTYNALDGLGDINKKYYLVDLFKKGFPVIPTVNNLKDLHQLGKPKEFLIKPQDGGGSRGIKKFKREDLLQQNTNGYLIQPFLDFEYEISFYYIDKIFQYALRSKSKTARWDLVIYNPSKKELELSQKFVDWNSLSYGIQRIDFCKTKEDRMLLMEVEDYCAYLSINELPKKVKKVFLKSFVDSLCLNLGIKIT